MYFSSGFCGGITPELVLMAKAHLKGDNRGSRFSRNIWVLGFMVKSRVMCAFKVSMCSVRMIEPRARFPSLGYFCFQCARWEWSNQELGFRPMDIFVKVSTCSVRMIKLRARFPSLGYFCFQHARWEWSNWELGFHPQDISIKVLIMLGVTEVRPLALCSSRSFLSTPDDSIYEVRLYQYSFGLRGDANLMVEDFLGNWVAFITLFPLDFAFYKRHPRGITFLHSQILRLSREL